MNQHEIDLKDHKSPGVMLLSFRRRGEEVRAAVGLDAIDEELLHDPEASVVVRIPDEVVRITSSFFLGLFGNSIRALGGEDAFLERFHFDGHYSKDALHSAAEEAMKWGSAIPHARRRTHAVA